MERKGFLFAEFKSSLFDATEKLGLGVSEEIDGLHGIADDEDCTVGAIGPCGYERADEFVLTATGVLEFVDKQMANIISDRECGIGGELVFTAENAASDLRDFDEVNGACFGEGGF